MILRPTAALLRSVVIAALTAIAVVVFGRTELIIFAAGFVCWTVLGAMRRPGRRGGLPAVVEPRQELSARRLRVGQVTRLEVHAGDERLVTGLSVARPPHCDVEPPLGLRVGVGRAAVDVRVQRWGRHTITPNAAAVGDDWGLWGGIWTPASRVVQVSPQVGAPGRGEAIPHPVGLVGVHPSRVRGEGTALAEVRPFVLGDRLRRVNWRVTSRTGALHTNATTAERDTEVVIVTDTLADFGVPERPSVHGSAELDSSLDITVTAASSAADHFLRLGDRVALHDLGHVIGSIPPGAGVRQRTIVIEQLAKASIERMGNAPLRRLRRVRPGSLVVCCSPLLDPEVITEILQLSHRGAAVLAIDTLPPALGQLRPGSGSRWQRGIARFQTRDFWDEAWSLRRLERDAELKRLTSLGVPVIAWRGIESLAQMVTALAVSRSAPRMARR